MTSLPLAFFKGCTSGNTDPNSPTSPLMANKNGHAIGNGIDYISNFSNNITHIKQHPSMYLFYLFNIIGRSISTGNDPLKGNIMNNNTVKNATKFTIGTSDESDEDDNAENTEDLEHLFCPLTDSQVIVVLITLFGVGYKHIY